MLGGGDSTDDVGSCILSHLKRMEGAVFETKVKSPAEAVIEDSYSVWSEGRVEKTNLSIPCRLTQ